MQTMTTEETIATNKNQVIRLRRYARGEHGGAVQITIVREEGRVEVIWNANNGAFWHKAPFHKVFRGATAESDARAFMEQKWATCTDWLQRLNPKQGAGVAGAFSAQVSSMRGAS